MASQSLRQPAGQAVACDDAGPFHAGVRTRVDVIDTLEREIAILCEQLAAGRKEADAAAQRRGGRRVFPADRQCDWIEMRRDRLRATLRAVKALVPE